MVQLNQIRDQLRELFSTPAGRPADPRGIGPSWLAGGGTVSRGNYDGKQYLTGVGLQPDLEDSDLKDYIVKETERRTAASARASKFPPERGPSTGGLAAAISSALPPMPPDDQIAGPSAPHWPRGETPEPPLPPPLAPIIKPGSPHGQRASHRSSDLRPPLDPRSSDPRASPAAPSTSHAATQQAIPSASGPLDTVKRIPFQGGKYRQHREVQTDISELSEVRQLQSYVAATKGELDNLRDLLTRLRQELIAQHDKQLQAERDSAESYVREMRQQGKKAMDEALERHRLAEASRLSNLLAIQRQRAEDEKEQAIREETAQLASEKAEMEALLHEGKLAAVAMQHEMQAQAGLIKGLQAQVATMKSDMEQGGYDPMVKVLRGEARALEERISDLTIQLKRRDDDNTMLESARKTIQGQLATALTEKAQSETRFKNRMKKVEDDYGAKMSEMEDRLRQAHQEFEAQKMRADGIEADLNRQIQVTDLMNQRYTEALKKLKADNQLLKTALHREEKKWRQRMESMGMGGMVGAGPGKGTNWDAGSMAYSTASKLSKGSKAPKALSRVMSQASSRDDSVSLSQFLNKGKSGASKNGSVVSGYTYRGPLAKRGGGGTIAEEDEIESNARLSHAGSQMSRQSRDRRPSSGARGSPTHHTPHIPSFLSPAPSGGLKATLEEEEEEGGPPITAHSSSMQRRASVDQAGTEARERRTSVVAKMRQSVSAAKEDGIEITAAEEVEAILQETADVLDIDSEEEEDLGRQSDSTFGADGLIVTSASLRTPAFNRLPERDRRLIGGRVILGRSPAADAAGMGRSGGRMGPDRANPGLAVFRDKMDRMQMIVEQMQEYGRKLEEELKIHQPLRPLTMAEASAGATLRATRASLTSRLDQLPVPMAALGIKANQEQAKEGAANAALAAKETLKSVSSPRRNPLYHPPTRSEGERLLDEIESGGGAALKMPFKNARKKTARLGYMVKNQFPSRGFFFQSNPSALYVGTAEEDEVVIWRDGQEEEILADIMGEDEEGEEGDEDEDEDEDDSGVQERHMSQEPSFGGSIEP